MSGFAWVDRHGRRHTLDRAAPIEAELAAVARELAAHADDLESSDQDKWEAALAATEPLVARHNALVADLERWNAHVAASNRTAAAEAVAAIDGLVADADLIGRLHAHYADHAKDTSANGASPASAGLLALVRAIATRHAATVPVVTTAAEAHAWLSARPDSNRTPLAPAHPAFAWVDRHGHTIQVRSLVEIEREQLTLIGELAGLRPKLLATADPKVTALALEQVRVAMTRISILQRDAERWATHVGGIRRQGARDRAMQIRTMQQ